jgi:alcohol dehydrogenase class IV
MPYEFLGPRKIIMGDNSIDFIPNEIRRLKKDNPLIVTDRGIVEAGILNLMTQKLNIRYFLRLNQTLRLQLWREGEKYFLRVTTI